MRIAIIDLGTNSIRFDVHSLAPSQSARALHPKLLHREKLMVRLGESVFLTGRLEAGAVRRTLAAFRHFHLVCKKLHVNKIVAFATSAMREAQDRDRLVRSVYRLTKIRLKIISGIEEAKLIAEGIIQNEPIAQGKFGLVDIGGGSTEVSVCRGKKILRCSSFPLGVARLQQIFLKTNPPTHGAQSVRELRNHLRGLLKETFRAQSWPSVDKIIGSSGTIRTLARMARKQLGTRHIPRDWLHDLVERMTPLSDGELGQLEGMDPRRSDLILAGTVVLEECMRGLHCDKAFATTYSLRDGILDNEMAWIRPKNRGFSKTLEDLYLRAETFGVTRERATWRIRILRRIFHETKGFHRIPESLLPYLEIAEIFRDVGQWISPVNLGDHSHYIVQHLDLPLPESWETELVALLCKMHSASLRELKDIEWTNKPPPTLKKAFPKMVALTTLAECYELAYPADPRIVSLVRRKGRSHFRLGRSTTHELIALRILQKLELLKSVLGIESAVVGDQTLP